MQYTAIYDLKNSAGGTPVSDLKKKVTVSVATAAQTILTESETVPNHTARARWARTALSQAESVAEQMMWAVLSNGTITAAGNASLDSDVLYVVTVMVDLFAQ